MVEEVTTLKKDFKQKEYKYLEEFLDMKALKEKVEGKLFKQDQSLQTVHMLCNPKPHYDEKKKVAIGYKNPLYLTRAKQVQPALYNGFEIVKTHHAPAIVHDSEDTLEIAETTRKTMNDKNERPNKQLTPEQIFWYDDILKEKAKALKAKSNNPKSITTVMVYPPNTPTKLVLRVLPTKSQAKINIFALIQLFSEFDKTCKKRITPTGLTEGERGFEQTKECYLTEVIPFFKTFKEHFEGIQQALTKVVKEMKEIFEELEAEVDQNVMDRKCDEIERKNLLITNENLIVDCLTKDVFYTTKNYVLTVSRFSEMHDAYTIEHAHCQELEAELSKLKHKIQKDDHSEMIKCFSNLEIDHLNLQLNYQNLKERFGNNKSQPSQDAPEFDTVFKINKMKASLQGKDNTIRKLQVQISQLKETHQNELFRTENAIIKQHYKELYDSIKTMRAKTVEKTSALLSENENLKAQILGKIKCVTMNSEKPTVLVPGMYAIDVEPIHPRNRNNREVHLECLKHLKIVRFGNDHFGAIMGYGDYVIGDNLEVAFRKHSCYVRNEDGVELLKVSRGSNLYTISVEDMMKSSPICLFSKASKNKSWLWHHRLNHLNFFTINETTRKDLFKAHTRSSPLKLLLYPPTNKDLEILFQPMFDEYLEPPRVERPVPPAPAVQVLVVSAGTPSFTTVDQGAPSTSHSPSSSVVQPPISHQCVVA
ncbi:retrovirus-related pol polyprotein from transposon TNT 1-94 [Tanacetum coccineum]|uniref:Retrovirus-related pol polyprotein from transposon TNT 1-94 n=1 Tax=Tanacetum coccineum TaxID=301880 RepID=A0ABQ4ZAF3_9ASTR